MSKNTPKRPKSGKDTKKRGAIPQQPLSDEELVKVAGGAISTSPFNTANSFNTAGSFSTFDKLKKY